MHFILVGLISSELICYGDFVHLPQLFSVLCVRNHCAVLLIWGERLDSRRSSTILMKHCEICVGSGLSWAVFHGWLRTVCVYVCVMISRRKTSVNLPVQYVGLPHCGMTGCCGRVLLRLLCECMSACLILLSSELTCCTFESRFLFFLDVCERNQGGLCVYVLGG